MKSDASVSSSNVCQFACLFSQNLLHMLYEEEVILYLSIIKDPIKEPIKRAFVKRRQNLAGDWMNLLSHSPKPIRFGS